METITSEELTPLIKELTSYEHKILYYGSEEPMKVNEILERHHKRPSVLKTALEPKEFPELPMKENKVYIVDYNDMVQAEVIILTKREKYDNNIVPVISLYNEY